MTNITSFKIVRYGVNIGVAIACGFFAFAGPSALAQDYFKGKQITLFVGYAPGGGYDTYARTLARHYSKHIPGGPSIVVKNQPGAGSMKLANYLFNSAPKDGREIGAVGREIPTATLLKAKYAKFRSDQFNWLGSLSSDGAYCIAWHTAPITKPAHMFTKQFIVGATTGRSPTMVLPIIMNNLLDTKIKIIAGYPGGAAMHLAMERGEVQGRCSVSMSSLNASRPDWIRDKKVRFLLDLSLLPKRRMADVPLISEYAKSEEDKKKLRILLAPNQWTRPYLAPPGLPADRLAVLRAAFDKTIEDPAYKKDIARQKLVLAPMSGKEMVRRITRLQKSPQGLVNAAIEAATRRDKTEMAKVVVPVVKATGKITKVARGGRRVSFKAGAKKGKLRVSSRNTKVSIGGKKAKRSALKAGMSCDFAFQGSAARVIACK